MADEEEKTPISDEDISDEGEEEDSSYEDEFDATEEIADLSQDITVEDATDFIQDETNDEMCDFEVMDELDLSQSDQQSHLVTQSATIYTTDYITKFEKSRVLGLRSQQIKSRAAIMIPEDMKYTKPNGKEAYIFKDGKYPRESFTIASKELEFGRCPIIIGRRFPNGEKMMVKVSNLKLI